MAKKAKSKLPWWRIFCVGLCAAVLVGGVAVAGVAIKNHVTNDNKPAESEDEGDKGVTPEDEILDNAIEAANNI